MDQLPNLGKGRSMMRAILASAALTIAIAVTAVPTLAQQHSHPDAQEQKAAPKKPPMRAQGMPMHRQMEHRNHAKDNRADQLNRCQQMAEHERRSCMDRATKD
jgi:hypothetical protein